jgi:hypothetical protein
MKKNLYLLLTLSAALIIGCNNNTTEDNTTTEDEYSHKIKCNNDHLVFKRQYISSKKDELGHTVGSFHNLIQTSDNGYIIAGQYLQDLNDTNRSNDAWIMGLDARGNIKFSKVIWKYNYPKAGSYDENFNQVTKIEDKYLLSGNIISWAINLDGTIFTMIDKNGNVLWKKYMIPKDKDENGGIGNLHIKRTITLSDGNILAVGDAKLLYSKTNDDGSVTKWFAPTGVVIKMDQNGSILFAKGYAADKPEYSSNGLNTQWNFYSATEQNSFIYVIGGGYGPDNKNGYTVLLKIDKNGNVIWGKKYKGNDYDDRNILSTIYHDIVSVKDGGLLTIYTLENHSIYNAGDQWMKLNEDGYIEWAGEYNNSKAYYWNSLNNIKKSKDGNYILSNGATGLLKVAQTGNPIKLLTTYGYDIFTTTSDNGVAVVTDQTYIVSPSLTVSYTHLTLPTIA